MLPSRGLRPVHGASFASVQTIYARSGASRRIASRQFSSIPRTSSFAARPRRTCIPQVANGRLYNSRHVLSIGASVRHASWYAPWSWGRSSSTPTEESPTASVSTVPPPEPAAEPLAVASKPVTTATPDLATASIEIPAAVPETAIDKTTHSSVEELVDNVLQSDSLTPLRVENFGDLKAMGLDYGWGTTAFFEWLIEHVYLYSGLGWGASIIGATLVIRLLLFRFQIKASDNMARMAAVQPITKDLTEQIRAAVAQGNSALNRSLKRKQMKIYKQVGVSAWAPFVPLIVQGVLGFGAFRCLRGMSNLPVPGLAENGWLWFSNLTVSDPYYLLPALSAGVMYLVVKRGGETGASDQMSRPGMKFAMQVLFPGFMFIIGIFQPAAIQLYLFNTAVLSAASATLLRQKSFRERVGIAPLPTKDAQEMWTKVADGEIPLSRVMKDGKMIDFAPQPKAQPVSYSYQAPGKAPKVIENRGLKVKAGVEVPKHLQETKRTVVDKQNPDRDEDFDTPPENFFKRIDWFARNYQPKFLYRRLKTWMATVSGREDVQGELLQRKKDIAKRKTEEYELRRRQRLKQS